MGKYTIYGSNDFEQRVEDDLKKIVTAIRQVPHSQNILAVVLMGGYGRGEGTPYTENGVQRPFNDYDLIVVCKNLSFSQSKQLKQALHQLEGSLTSTLEIPVDLYLHSVSSLKHAEPSLMNYELRNGHITIFGPQDILNIMPNYDLKTLPINEGTRLLLNRGKLLLDVKISLGSDTPLTDEQIQQIQKFIWKNHLAFGDCVLLSYGDYAISYQEKAKRIENYLTVEGIPDPTWMVSQYLNAIEFKLKGDPSLLDFENLYHSFSDTVRYYLGFLLWYEGRRLGTALPSLQTYCAKLPQCPSTIKQRLKAFLLNVKYLRSGMFNPTYRWAIIHPRYRLFPALWLLLSFDSSIHMDLGLIIQLLNGDRNYAKLLNRFYELYARLK